MSVSTKFSDAEHYCVLDEMNRILADPKFSSSKRCVKLFRRLIEGALEGDQDGIKERMLGIEVFGRDTNYDTNADPVVRMAASEIRKRLAHFYQESDQEHSVTIRLIPGSYVPEFDFNSESAKVVPADASALAALSERNTRPVPVGESFVAKAPIGGRPVWQSWGLRIGVLFLLALGITAFGMYHRSRLSPKYPPQWSPLIESSVLIVCFSDNDPLKPENLNDPVTPNVPAKNGAASRSESEVGPFHRIVFEEVKAFYKVSALLIRQGKDNVRFRPCSEFTPRDLHNSSAIIIGGSDNPWSIRMLSNLRYSLHFDPLTGNRWIEDAQNPSKRDWKVDGNASQIETDYAVIARFFNQETGGWVLVLAGLYPYGTESAADLMTDRLLVQTIPKSIQANTNFEMVVQTHIVDQVPSHPAIVAVYTW